MKKRAVLVGINEHANSNYNLYGCVNDVVDIRNAIIEHHEFCADDVRVVCDARATKEGIKSRLRWLINSSQPGDVAYFHYSGHGAQIRDRNGDELKDCKDELLCCYDMNWDDPFTDDELADLLSQFDPGVKIYLTLDCCHSGSGSRSIEPSPGDKHREIHPIKGRAIMPPIDILMRSDGQKLQTRQMVNSVEQTMNHVLFTGAKSDQTAADANFNGRSNGAFSYYFTYALKRKKGIKEIHSEVNRWLSEYGFSQISCLEGPDNLLDGQIFS